MVLGVLAPLLKIDGIMPPLGADCPISLGFFGAPKSGVEWAAELAFDLGSDVPKMLLTGSFATSASVAFWGVPRAPNMFLTGSFAAGSISAAFCGVPNIGGAVEAGFCVPKMDWADPPFGVLVPGSGVRLEMPKSAWDEGVAEGTSGCSAGFAPKRDDTLELFIPPDSVDLAGAVSTTGFAAKIELPELPLLLKFIGVVAGLKVKSPGTFAEGVVLCTGSVTASFAGEDGRGASSADAARRGWPSDPNETRPKSPPLAVFSVGLVDAPNGAGVAVGLPKLKILDVPWMGGVAVPVLATALGSSLGTTS